MPRGTDRLSRYRPSVTPSPAVELEGNQMASGSRPSALRITRTPLGASDYRMVLEPSVRGMGGASLPKPSGTRLEHPSAHRLPSGTLRVLQPKDQEACCWAPTSSPALRHREGEWCRLRPRARQVPRPLRTKCD